MKLCALFSGGKDSTMAIYKAIQEHEVAVLLSMISDAEDSYMYHVPNIHLTEQLAEALGIPLITKKTSGKPPEENTDLKHALKEVKEGWGVEGVCVGAVHSNYQYKIVSEACNELNLKVYAPYWQKNHIDLITDAINEGFRIILVAVAAEGLTEEWLGRTIDRDTLQELKEIHRKHRIDVGGEGGEYETLVLDGPIYKKRLKITDAVKKWDKTRGELRIEDAELENK